MQRLRTTTSLILAGVAVGSFLTAIQTYEQQRNTKTLLEVYSWILGGLSGVDGWGEVLLVLPYVAVCIAVLLASRRLLDVMAVGDEEADSLGVRATRVRLLVVVAATLATASVVAVSGLVGFVGIIVPHTIRLVVGPSYRRILPLSILVGAAFLILADLVARAPRSPLPRYPSASSRRSAARRSSCSCCGSRGGRHEDRDLGSRRRIRRRTGAFWGLDRRRRRRVARSDRSERQRQDDPSAIDRRARRLRGADHLRRRARLCCPSPTRRRASSPTCRSDRCCRHK